MSLTFRGKVEWMYRLGHYHYAMVFKAMALDESPREWMLIEKRFEVTSGDFHIWRLGE